MLNAQVVLRHGSVEVCIDLDSRRGGMEHDVHGELGGLWFTQHGTGLALEDFDGQHILPKEAAQALREYGVHVGPEFD